MYPKKGSYEHQAVWFIELLRLCGKYVTEIRKSNVN